VAEPLGTDQCPVPLGIEVVVLHGQRAEGAPSAAVPPGARALRIVQPAEQLALGVLDQQLVEELGIQSSALQGGERLIDELRQRVAQGRGGGHVAGKVQCEPAVRGAKERGHRPVLAVGLGPEGAAILQLGERLQHPRALLDRPQLLPADAGQVEDRHVFVRPVRLGQGTRDHRAQPDRRTRLCGRFVVAQR